MYRPKHYTIEELAHPQIIRTIGVENTWRRLDEEALRDLDYIREAWHKEHGSGIYVNRLAAGWDSRGLRPPNDPDGSFYSIHKQGAAFDLEPVNGDLFNLWGLVFYLIKNDELIKLNTIEDRDFTPSWVHVAYMNHRDDPPLIIKP